MKNFRKFVLSVISVMAFASCVNDNLSEPWESEANKVLASVADQAKAVEGSIEAVESSSSTPTLLQKSLASGQRICETSHLNSKWVI